MSGTCAARVNQTGSFVLYSLQDSLLKQRLVRFICPSTEVFGTASIIVSVPRFILRNTNWLCFSGVRCADLVYIQSSMSFLGVIGPGLQFSKGQTY